MADDRHQPEREVSGPMRAARRERAEGDAGEARHEKRGRHQQDGRGQPFADHANHGLAVNEGRAEVPADDVPRVDEQLFAYWAIEPEPSPDERVVSGVPVLASERDDRITRRHVNQDERQQEEPGDRGQRLSEPPEQIPAAHRKVPRATPSAYCLQNAASAKSPVHALKPAQRVGHARVLKVSTSQR